jgi:hypothetical protein
MVMHTRNPSIQGAEAKNHEFKVSLGYTVRLCLKNKQTNKKI